MGLWLPRHISLCRATTARASSLNSCFKLHIASSSPQSQYSTTSTPPAEYGYIHGVEHLSDYRPGGYHPLHIDDRLHKRYRIVHKLGHGAFSTAWLAIDEKTTKYVAIKLGTADADRSELDILSQITQSPVSRSILEDQPSLLPVVLDRFDVGGPNGTHPCLVTLPARCSLRDAREASGSFLFQLDVARSLAAQLVMAVSLVHARGYAHGGERPVLFYADTLTDPVL
ncbi:Serine/threonine-protein kinase SRPK [Metarhizium anisopliae]|nr:Serine/threonine-protein kinase SRPK [Metarhizium anisopliae]